MHVKDQIHEISLVQAAIRPTSDLRHLSKLVRHLKEISRTDNVLVLLAYCLQYLLLGGAQSNVIQGCPAAVPSTRTQVFDIDAWRSEIRHFLFIVLFRINSWIPIRIVTEVMINGEQNAESKA